MSRAKPQSRTKKNTKNGPFIAVPAGRPGIPRIYSAKQVGERLGVESGNLRAQLRALGVPEPEKEWRPGVYVYQLPNGPVYIDWLVDAAVAEMQRRREERHREDREATEAA